MTTPVGHACPDLTRGGQQVVRGLGGAVEVLVDLPADGSAAGGAAPVAIVAHPQPLLGGSATHKVPAFLARGLTAAGWTVLRPNFRGVGASEGQHDAGGAESDDLAALAEALRAAVPQRALALVGFSFGAFVQARVARRLADAGGPPAAVALAGMPHGQVESGRHYDPPTGLDGALVVHGERDAVVPLAAVLDWARPTAHPVVVVPGADHFFTGRLPVLRRLVVDHLQQAIAHDPR